MNSCSEKKNLQEYIIIGFLVLSCGKTDGPMGSVLDSWKPSRINKQIKGGFLDFFGNIIENIQKKRKRDRSRHEVNRFRVSLVIFPDFSRPWFGKGHWRKCRQTQTSNSPNQMMISRRDLNRTREMETSSGAKRTSFARTGFSDVRRCHRFRGS